MSPKFHSLPSQLTPSSIFGIFPIHWETKAFEDTEIVGDMRFIGPFLGFLRVGVYSLLEVPIVLLDLFMISLFQRGFFAKSLE